MFRIIQKLGGIDATLEVLERRRVRQDGTGRPYKRMTRWVVDFWARKGSIPPINVLPLIEECKARGIPYDMSDFQYEPSRKRRRA